MLELSAPFAPALAALFWGNPVPDQRQGRGGEGDGEFWVYVCVWMNLDCVCVCRIGVWEKGRGVLVGAGSSHFFSISRKRGVVVGKGILFGVAFA